MNEEDSNSTVREEELTASVTEEVDTDPSQMEPASSSSSDEAASPALADIVEETASALGDSGDLDNGGLLQKQEGGTNDDEEEDNVGVEDELNNDDDGAASTTATDDDDDHHHHHDNDDDDHDDYSHSDGNDGENAEISSSVSTSDNNASPINYSDNSEDKSVDVLDKVGESTKSSDGQYDDEDHENDNDDDTKERQESTSRKISSESNDSVNRSFSPNRSSLELIKPGFAKQPSPMRSALDGISQNSAHVVDGLKRKSSSTADKPVVSDAGDITSSHENVKRNGKKLMAVKKTTESASQSQSSSENNIKEKLNDSIKNDKEVQEKREFSVSNDYEALSNLKDGKTDSVHKEDGRKNVTDEVTETREKMHGENHSPVNNDDVGKNSDDVTDDAENPQNREKTTNDDQASDTTNCKSVDAESTKQSSECTQQQQQTSEIQHVQPTFYIEDLSDKTAEVSETNLNNDLQETNQAEKDPALLHTSEYEQIPVQLSDNTHQKTNTVVSTKSTPDNAKTDKTDMAGGESAPNDVTADRVKSTNKKTNASTSLASNSKMKINNAPTNDLSKETKKTTGTSVDKKNISQSEHAQKVQATPSNANGSSKRNDSKTRRNSANSSSENHQLVKANGYNKADSNQKTAIKKLSSFDSASPPVRPESSTVRATHSRSSSASANGTKNRDSSPAKPSTAKKLGNNSQQKTAEASSVSKTQTEATLASKQKFKKENSRKPMQSSDVSGGTTQRDPAQPQISKPSNIAKDTPRNAPKTPPSAKKRSTSAERKSAKDQEILSRADNENKTNSSKTDSSQKNACLEKKDNPEKVVSSKTSTSERNKAALKSGQPLPETKISQETTSQPQSIKACDEVAKSGPAERKPTVKKDDSANKDKYNVDEEKTEKNSNKGNSSKSDVSNQKSNTPRPNTSKKSNVTETQKPKDSHRVGGSVSKLLTSALKGDWSAVDAILRGTEKVSSDSFRGDHDQGITPLMLAAKESRLVIAEKMIELGANVNERAKDGRTAVHFAAAHAKDDLVKLLVARKADCTLSGGAKDQLPLHMACARASGVLNMVQILLRSASKDTRCIQDKDGMVALFMAAEVGNTAVCRELLNQQNEQQVKLHRKDTGDTPLHIACRRKDFDIAKLFVDNGAPVDAKNRDGHTPLHVSAWEGDDTLVKYLHMNKANPNIVDKSDRSPLHIAAERGHTAVVEILVDKVRANVSARTKDGSTLMHIASEFGHPDTALAFLKKGVPLLMPNKSGALCLHSAARKGHVNVLKALIQKGALPDSTTKDNYTALHVAVEHCKPLTVQTLLGHGAQVELKGGKAKETPLHIAARIKDGEKCAEMLIKSGADVNATRENGETALHIASRNGYLKMVKALVAEGADPSWQSKAGETPLHIAVRYCHWEVSDELLTFITKSKSKIDAAMLVNYQNVEGETSVHYAAELTKKHTHHEFEDTDIIKVLLSYDGDINIATKLTQETPLHYCARSGNADVMLEIVKHIGPGKTQYAVNRQAKNGWSPLLVASEEGHLDIVKILLQHNARVDVFDEHGKAALHLAAESGHGDVGDVLLWHRAFVNAKSKLGVTPLHLASQNGFSNFVKLLIETHGATIDALSLAKKTPLHLAAQHGKIDVCHILLKMKADANATDVHGQTPLHLAAENDHSDVVKLFLKHRPELVTMASTNGMTCAHIAASKGSVAVIKELMRFNKSVVTTARNKTSDSTTLHLAAIGGHAAVVKALIDAGASATDENSDGMTAIHLAARYGHINVLNALQDKVSWKVTSSKTGLSALHVAAHYGQMDFVREILAKVPATVRSEMPHTSETALRDIGPEYGFTPLHLASQSGHEGIVRMLLNSPGVQADAATSVHGTIPLHQAAQHGHTAVVSLLLSKSTNQMHTKDKRGRTALHLGAANGHLDMVSLFLGQGADIDVYDKNGWTPMHCAAKAGHLPVVKLLMEAGANPKYETKDGKVPICYAAAASHAQVLSYLVKKDHDTHHLMEDKKFVFDLMVVGKMHQNEPIQEFVLTSPAPVETAVKLSKHFRLLAIKEKERAKDLLAAGSYCEAMATELNAIAASTNSAGMILKSVDDRGMPILDVLIECEQKEVVSHPSVQKYLSEVWLGHLSHWAGWKMIMLFAALLFVPPIWLAFSLPLKHRFNKVPVIKFMSYLVSHIYLIALYILVVVYPLTPIWQSSDLLPHWYEWLLLSWLSGLLVSQLTNPEDRAGLGWIKVIILAISCIGVSMHFLAFAFSGDSRLECVYIRNQFFGCSLMLCFVQMMDFLSFHHLFGPWAIIIRDLMKDLMRFLVILSIFMLGFTLQLAAIYQPVLPPTIVNPDLGDGDGAGGSRSEDAFATFEMLFFALFGLVEPENLPPVHRNPIWALTLIKAVFGVYLIVTLIVLINLLIAMMSDTYQRIQAQSDTEWKFGRAKLFRNMNKTSATPTPLNLLTKLFTYIKILHKHKGKVCSMTAQQYVDEEEELDVYSDARSVDASHAGGFLRNMTRRNTQVAPEGSFLHQSKSKGPVSIEDVVDWGQVVERYLVLQGISDNDSLDSSTQQRMDDMADPNEPKEVGANV